MFGDELARELIAAGQSDLKALGHMLDIEAFDDRIFGFHAQQAIEKALKAWLRILQQSHPFTHDLRLLLHKLEEQGADVESYWDFLDLSGYAVQFRYETFPEGEVLLERAGLLEEIRALFERVEKMLRGSSCGGSCP